MDRPAETVAAQLSYRLRIHTAHHSCHPSWLQGCRRPRHAAQRTCQQTPPMHQHTSVPSTRSRRRSCSGRRCRSGSRAPYTRHRCRSSGMCRGQGRQSHHSWLGPQLVHCPGERYQFPHHRLQDGGYATRSPTTTSSLSDMCLGIKLQWDCLCTHVSTECNRQRAVAAAVARRIRSVAVEVRATLRVVCCCVGARRQ